MSTQVNRRVPWARLKELPHVLGIQKHRHCAVGVGLGRNGTWVMHDNNIANSRRAVLERVFAVETKTGLAPPPRSFANVFPRTLGAFGASVARLCAWTPPLTPDEFVGLYTGARASRYRAAVEGLATKPFTAKDAYLNSFVKGELVNLSDSKPDPAPRIIQPRSARYNVLVGCFLRPLEHKLYEAITEVFLRSGVGAGLQVVFKGINARQSASILREKWLRPKNPEARGLDATRFDQHVGPPALDWEHNVYLQCFPPHLRKTLAALLRLQLLNKGFVRCADGAFSYQVRGGRMSGDMNTAMGNCLLSCAIVHRFAVEHNIPLELANNGDDCQLIYDRKYSKVVDTFGAWALKYGFQIKMEQPVHEFEQIEFCQTQPVLVAPNTWTMCRSPKKALAKDVIMKEASARTSTEEYRRWLKAVSDCGLALCEGVPVMESFYRMLARHGLAGSYAGAPRFEDSGFARMARGVRKMGYHVTPAGRHSFWLAFGVAPDDQEVIERHFDSLVLDLSRRDGQSLTSTFHPLNFL